MGSRRNYEIIGGDPFTSRPQSQKKPVSLRGPHSYQNLKLTIDEEDSQDENDASQYQGPSNVREELLPMHHNVGGPPDDHHATLDVNRGEIGDLDEFFCRVYNYHQRGGFTCMLIEDSAQLFQFAFVVCFTVFLVQCVDYDILFSNKLPPNATGNRTEKSFISNAVISNCAAHLNPLVVICIIVAVAFWCLRLARMLLQLTKYYEINHFFANQLMVTNDDLPNLTWYELAAKIINAQENTQFCINQSQLSELDMCMRILRRKNYFVAMVNQNILPPKFNLPFFGEICIFSNGLKLNLEWLLFTGPWAPWSDYFTIRKEYRRRENIGELSMNFDRIVWWLGIGNLILSPVVLLWTVLYSFFSYAELLKRQPGALGTRRWSLYGRYLMRHFNELDHEVVMRLNRGFRPATQYLDLFTTKLGEIIAKNVAFIAASFFVVLATLSIWDEDVIEFEHVLTAMTIFGAIVYAAKIFIQDENLVWCPELLLQAVLAQTHYMPDSWKGFSHTDTVRAQFSQIFQFKMSFLIEELTSAITTPLILLFWVRPRIPEILDFLQRYTISVPGLGDVCSFSTMDIDRHGDPTWNNEQQPPGHADRALNGKTELSLVNFKLRNPNWNPRHPNSAKFLDQMKIKMMEQANEMNTAANLINDNPLGNSINSLLTGGLCSIAPAPYANMARSIIGNVSARVEGRGVANADAPISTAPQEQSILASIQGIGNQHQSYMPSVYANAPSMYATSTQASIMESTALEMSINALYLHNMHTRHVHNRGYGAILETPADVTHETQLVFQQPVSSDENDDDSPPNLFGSGI